MKKGMNELDKLESILMQSMKNEELKKKKKLSLWTYEVIQSSVQLYNYSPKIKGYREMYCKK